MTTFCPRCGQAGRDESVVMPLVSVWASCERCHFVWRSSLLDTMKEFAARGARRTLGEKVVDRYSPAPQVQIATGDDSPQPASADRVAEWLASQEKSSTLLKAAPAIPIASRAAEVETHTGDPVEDFFDRMEPVEGLTPHVKTVEEAATDFYSFFGVDAADLPTTHESVEQWIEEPIAPLIAEPVHEAPVVQAAQESPVVQSVAVATPLEKSVDRALTDVEDLYDAFKRLEEQLGGMEKWCAELANSR